MRVVPAGGGEVVGDSPQRRVEILSDADPVHATVARLAAGGEGADLHVHQLHSDLFYVLDGELTVRLGIEDRQVVVAAGAVARVPPDVVHGFRNAGETDVRYLNFHAPGSGFADYMRALRDGRRLTYDQHDPPADGGRATSEAVVETGTEVAAGVELLTGVEAIRVLRVRGTLESGGDRLASYYVLEGELELGDVRAPAGAWVQVPAGEPHTARGAFVAVLT